MAHTRANPSPRYRQLISQYHRLHVEGERSRGIAPADMFSGENLLRHIGMVKGLCDRHRAQSLLDYGSGKGKKYRDTVVTLPDGTRYPSLSGFWGVSTISCYDPGYAPYSNLPTGKFDGVICTDVLEHCPEEDVDWIVAELFAFARKFVFANVACYPALKRLPDGQNAHCTIQQQEWWRELVVRTAACYPAIRYCLSTERIVPLPAGGQKLIIEFLEN
jgi:hypothetical protein